MGASDPETRPDPGPPQEQVGQVRLWERNSRHCEEEEEEDDEERDVVHVDVETEEAGMEQ